MAKDLTQGNVTKTMLLFAGPMILGNLLQQFYNIADTLIVGRFLGEDALAAGSAYTLMTGGVTLLLNAALMLCCDGILRLLQVPEELMEGMHTYVWIIFLGLFFVFLYN